MTDFQWKCQTICFLFSDVRMALAPLPLPLIYVRICQTFLRPPLPHCCLASYVNDPYTLCIIKHCFCSTRNFCWNGQNWSVIFKNYYWYLLNTNWFRNVPSFNGHSAYGSEVMGSGFLINLFQIIFVTPVNPNNIDLTLSPKNEFCKLDGSRFLV